MSIKNGDMPAMPVSQSCAEHPRYDGDVMSEALCMGLTKREEFARAAMQGILANPTGNQEPEGAEPEAVIAIVAMAAVRFADALLAELERTQ